MSCYENVRNTFIFFFPGDDTKIHSWNLTTGNHIHEYAGHFSKITSLTFTNDSKQMVSSSRDKVLILWNISQGQAVRTIPVFESVETVLVLPDKFKVAGQKFNEGLFVATAGEKGIIRLWNLNTNKEIFVQDNSLITPAKEDGGLAITKLLFQADPKQFAVVSVDHNIILYKLKTFECAKQFVGFSDEILDACFIGKSDEYLAVASNSADIKLYEVSNMHCKLLQGHTDIVLALCKATTEPHLLLSSSKDNTIRLWRILETSEVFCVGVGARHTGSVGSVAFSKSSATFAVSVSQDTCLKMWEIPQNCVKTSEKITEIQSLECLRTEIAHQKDINCVTISPNDKIIATGSQDKLCKLWDENLQLLGVLRGHKRGIWCAKFSPVDQVLITSSADCTVKLWSIQDLNCLKTLEGHESSVLKLEFLSNGMQILSAGADGLLKVFSVKSSECNMTLDQHEGRVWALALNSDENTIFSGGSDSLLVKWKDVTLEKKLEKAKQEEEIIVQVQQLANLVQNNELLKALKLSLRLDRPFQTLKIVQGIIKKGDSGLADTVKELSNDQKESLLKCASNWNTNSKHCQPAQLVINILINEVQSGDFKTQGLRSMVEGNLGYTDRHFKRLTQLMQDLYFINYTVNCMQPHAKNNV